MVNLDFSPYFLFYFSFYNQDGISLLKLLARPILEYNMINFEIYIFFIMVKRKFLRVVLGSLECLSD